VGVRHRCRIGSRLSVTVERQTGAVVRGIRVNPNVTYIRGRLSPPPLAAYSLGTWVWRNWSGSRRRLRLLTCVGAAAPSGA
jgi:hypothetical protein